jgi:hypothetical protein
MSDVNDKQYMSYIIVNDSSKSLLYMQLNTLMKLLLFIRAERKNSSSAATMDEFNYLSCSFIQKNYRLFLKKQV